jgi:hypothetical protein
MPLLNVLTFLLTISLTILALPSFAPKISLLVLLLLIFSIGLNTILQHSRPQYNNQGWSHNIHYGLTSIPLLAIILLCTWLSLRIFNTDSNIYADFILMVSHLMFFIFIVNTKDYIFLYKKYYIFLVFVMASFGLIANLLLTFDLIDISSHYFNLSEATKGAYTRDIGAGDSYAFPYSLGLILIGSGKLELLGFEFFRISGWAHEPTSATLFIAPAMILLLHGEVIKQSSLRLVMFVIICTFWFFAMSVGSLLAFLILYSMVILLILFINYFPYKLSISLFVGLSTSFMLFLYFLDPLLGSSIFTTKFDLESESLGESIEMLTWFIPSAEKYTSFYFSHLILWMIIFIFLFVAILGLMKSSKNAFPNPYALILLYIIIHSMKGSQGTVYYLFFSFFWFYIAYFSVNNKVDKLNNSLNRGGYG